MSPAECACGCGGTPVAGRWLPGHNHRARTRAAAEAELLPPREKPGAPRDCACGCGERTKRGRYRPGHDTRHLVAVAAALSGVPAGLLRAVLTDEERDRAAVVLDKVHGRALAAETNSLRAPIWQVEHRGHGRWLTLTNASYLRHRLNVFAYRGPLTVRDELVFSHVITKFVQVGRPLDNHVPFSLSRTARKLGLQEGGSGRQTVRESLQKLRAVTLESYLSVPGQAEPDWLSWGLLATAYTPGTAGRQGYVTLNEITAQLVRRGSVTLLDEPTFLALVAADEVAARLWTFLEAEKLPWSFALFDDVGSEAEDARWLPPLADLLGFADRNRRRVAARVREAVAAVVEHDPRYLGSELVHTHNGRWRLKAHRGAIGDTAAGAAGRADGDTEGGRPRTRRPGARGHADRAPEDTSHSEYRRSSPSFLPSFFSVVPRENERRFKEPTKRRTTEPRSLPAGDPAEPSAVVLAARRRQAVEGVLDGAYTFDVVARHLDAGDEVYLARGEWPPDLGRASAPPSGLAADGSTAESLPDDTAQAVRTVDTEPSS